jgi:hypothetical protein
MVKLAGMVLLAVGILLLVWAYDASKALDSEVSRVFRGSPTDRSMWLLIGGVAAGAAGIGLVLLPRRRSS